MFQELTNAEKTSGFRIQNKRFLLTYKTHLNKMEFIEHFEEKYKKWKPIFVDLCHENGNQDVEYEHSHVLVKFEKMAQSTNCRIFDYNEIHPNIKKVCSNKHWENLLDYCGKEDPEWEHKSPPNLADTVWKSESLQDALKNNVKNAGEALGIKVLYEARRCDLEIDSIDPNYPWQLELLEILEEKPDNRKVYWIYDPVGGTGKTQMSKYLMMNEPDKYHVLQNPPGGMRDAMTIINNALNTGWKAHAMIVNFTREKMENKFYGVLETIKDGIGTSVKYQGRTMVWPCPHLVIFANFLPDVDKMSADRWAVKQLDKQSLTMRGLTLKECRASLLKNTEF